MSEVMDSLRAAWKERCNLRREAAKLMSECERLRHESRDLRAEGDMTFIKAAVEARATVEWFNGGAKVNGETFTSEEADDE